MNGNVARIGVCCHSVSSFAGNSHFGCGEDYLSYIWDNGGLPIILAHYPRHLIPSLLETIDGLVLTGGEDIDPELYNEQRHELLGPLSPGRDEFEYLIGSEADRIGMPILAICRGCQMLNVIRGGSLLRDVDGHRVNNGPSPADKTHPIFIEPETLLAEILGSDDPATFYSSHHQAIARLGDNLRISARAPDQIIEAVEDPRADRFVLGLQGHPERYRAPHVDLIAGRFIVEAEQYSGRRVVC